MSGIDEVSPAPAVRHRLIIRHTQQDAVAFVVDNGNARLPTVVSEDRHTADVDHINAAVAQTFALGTTVLRKLSHGEPIDGIVERVHELELHGARGTAPANLRWCAASDLPIFPDPEDRHAIALWSGTPGSDAAVVDGRDWMRPGWFDAACDWIELSMREAVLGVPLEIRQPRSWASSCVLHVRTHGADYYFKALPRSGRVEWAVTRFLANQFANMLPAVVAVEPERRWMLLAACTGHNLETVTDVTLWERAAHAYGWLQVACSDHVDALEKLGCPVRTLDALARSIDSLAGDAIALRPGQDGGLTHVEFERFSRAVPMLQRRCQALAASRIRSTIEHGDLWPGNIFVDANACTVIDWEDVAIAHPFVSLAPLLVGMANAGLGSRSNVERIERAYLAAFRRFGSAAQLQRMLQLAAPLCYIEMAARYRHQPPSVVMLHPWMRDLIPQTVRLVLSRIPDGDSLDDGALGQTT